MPLNEEGLIDRVSIRHSVSPDAVRTILQALCSSGGSMAQFSHPDFGGMRHQIKLAHIAIKALERKAEPFLEDQRAVKDEISGH